MAGFFTNPFPFGTSNRNNNTPAATTYEPRATQLEPKNQNQQPQPPGTTGDPAAANPNNSADPTKGATTGEGSQLDQFNDLFKIKVDDKGQPVPPQQDPLAEPLINLDPAKLQEAASKMNFLAGIPQDKIQAAMSGQDPQAFMEVINLANRNAFTGATTMLSKVVESAITQNNQRIEQALPDRVRKVQISQTSAKNPALSHPSAAPLVNAMKIQIAQQNPHLSPERVAEMAENYFTSFASDLTAHDQRAAQQAQQQKSAEPDWSSILGS